MSQHATIKDVDEMHRAQAEEAAPRTKAKYVDWVPNFDFGEALKRMKVGKKVARGGWNGKGMFIFLGVPILQGAPEKFADDVCGMRNSSKVRPSICMKDSEDKIVVGWLASQTDMLSEDWVEVP